MSVIKTLAETGELTVPTPTDADLRTALGDVLAEAGVTVEPWVLDALTDAARKVR